MGELWSINTSLTPIKRKKTVWPRPVTTAFKTSQDWRKIMAKSSLKKKPALRSTEQLNWPDWHLRNWTFQTFSPAVAASVQDSKSKIHHPSFWRSLLHPNKQDRKSIMKARESKDISSATPKIQCQVSEQRRERSPFPNHHPARIEGSSWNNWFWQECVKSFAFCAEVGRKGSLLGNEAAAAANSSKVKAVDRNLIWCKYAKHVNLSSCPAVPKHYLKGRKAISMTTVNPGKSGFVFTKN